MTDEELYLLQKDMGGRFRNGVVVKYYNERYIGYVVGVDECQVDVYDREENTPYFVRWDDFKPYLRPMSSMTAEEENFYYSCLDEMDGYKQTFPVIYQDKALSLLDWLNAHHFDYRGLIEKGLAIEAPEDMYKF